MGRILPPPQQTTSTKPVYGSNTIEISCDLDEEERQMVDHGTAYEQPHEPFENFDLAEILTREMSGDLAA